MSTSARTQWNVERRRFIEAGGNTTHSFGLGRMIGRVYSLLYLTTDAICLDDIANQLNVSKASISIVVRQLSEWQAVRHVALPEDRRDFYEAQTDFLLVLRSGIMPGLRKKLQSAGSQITRALEAEMPVSDADSQDAHSENAPLPKEQQIELRRRLRTAQNWHRRIDRLLASKLLSRFFNVFPSLDRYHIFYLCWNRIFSATEGGSLTCKSRNPFIALPLKGKSR